MSINIEVKDRFFALLGLYPVIMVSEYCNKDDYPDAYEHDDYFNGVIDIALLDRINEWSFAYVEHFFDAILTQLARGSAPTRFTADASRKYSFGDTPDWWQNAVVGYPLDRVVLRLDIAVHS